MDLHAEDITTERLRLRLLETVDAEWIAREIANPKVHRWLTSVPKPYGVSDAIEFIGMYNSTPGYRVIVHQDHPVGVISIGTNGSERPDLGYWIEEAAWGQGIMTEAARAMIAWHLEIHNETIGSGWIRGNAASENVLRKLGFVDAGTRMVYAHFHGEEVTVDRVVLEVS